MTPEQQLIQELMRLCCGFPKSLNGAFAHVANSNAMKRLFATIAKQLWSCCMCAQTDSVIWDARDHNASPSVPASSPDERVLEN